MKPPPSRYRVIERGGRLIVIDTWEKGRSGGDTVGAPAVQRAGMPTTMERAGPLAAISRWLVALACVGARDDMGRPILTTSALYDEKGAREITLSPASEQRLGRVLALGLLIVAIVIVILWAFPFLFFVAIFGGAMVSRVADSTVRAMITRWIDQLEPENAA